MIQYSVYKEGKLTNRWTSADGMDETHYEPSFGLPERPELDEEGNPTGNTLPAEYTVVIEDITNQVEQQQTNEQARKYLAETDWYIIREMDSGEPCPQEIKTARAAARAQIV